MILSVALCEMCQCYSTDSIIRLIPGQWQADWLMSSLGPLGPGPVPADGWERLKGWWWGRWRGKGALEEAKGVEGERACETLEFIPKLMARDRLQVTPPHSSPPSHPHPQRRRRDQQVGWALWSDGRQKEWERVRESMCFPQARQQLRDNDLCFSQNSGISKCYI